MSLETGNVWKVVFFSQVVNMSCEPVIRQKRAGQGLVQNHGKCKRRSPQQMCLSTRGWSILHACPEAVDGRMMPRQLVLLKLTYSLHCKKLNSSHSHRLKSLIATAVLCLGQKARLLPAFLRLVVTVTQFAGLWLGPEISGVPESGFEGAKTEGQFSVQKSHTCLNIAWVIWRWASPFNDQTSRLKIWALPTKILDSSVGNILTYIKHKRADQTCLTGLATRFFVGVSFQVVSALTHPWCRWDLSVSCSDSGWATQKIRSPRLWTVFLGNGQFHANQLNFCVSKPYFVDKWGKNSTEPVLWSQTLWYEVHRKKAKNSLLTLLREWLKSLQESTLSDVKHPFSGSHHPTSLQTLDPRGYNSDSPANLPVEWI